MTVRRPVNLLRTHLLTRLTRVELLESYRQPHQPVWVHDDLPKASLMKSMTTRTDRLPSDRVDRDSGGESGQRLTSRPKASNGQRFPCPALYLPRTSIGKQGSGPDRGRSPVEWGDFLYVCPSVRPLPSVRPSPPLGHPARPEAQPARPEA